MTAKEIRKALRKAGHKLGYFKGLFITRVMKGEGLYPHILESFLKDGCGTIEGCYPDGTVMRYKCPCLINDKEVHGRECVMSITSRDITHIDGSTYTIINKIRYRKVGNKVVGYDKIK